MRRSFLIQILKFGREAQDCPSRGQMPQRPYAGSLAEYVKAAASFICPYDSEPSPASPGVGDVLNYLNIFILLNAGI
jgi:hypothetical protein